jgi:hypothetical protein
LTNPTFRAFFINYFCIVEREQCPADEAIFNVKKLIKNGEKETSKRNDDYEEKQKESETG